MSLSWSCLLTASSFQNYSMCNKFRIKVFKVLHVLILESFMCYRFEQCNKDFFHVLVKKMFMKLKSTHLKFGRNIKTELSRQWNHNQGFKLNKMIPSGDQFLWRLILPGFILVNSGINIFHMDLFSSFLYSCFVVEKEEIISK